MAHTITAERVLTATGWVERAAVRVEDGAVRSVEPLRSDASPRHAILVPGFVDLQVNGIDDVDVATAEGAAWERLDSLLAAQGVTTWCPTLVTGPMHRYAPALQRIDDARRRAVAAPAIAGAHLEGPFLGGAPGAHRVEHLQPIDLDWLAALPDVVTVVTLAAELPGAPDAIAMLRRRGILVSLGHSAPTRRQFLAAVDAGAGLVTHLYNGMSGLHHRSPGLAAFALTDDRVCTSLIADGVHVDPVMMALAWRARPDAVVLVTDAVAWRAGTAGAIRLTMDGAAPRLSDGTLAGSALTMIDAVRRTVETCGVALDQAVIAASTRPAQLLGLLDRGVIAPGRRADLVALDDEFRVTQTWVQGQALLAADG